MSVVADYQVELPAGGVLHLQTPDEVQKWQDSLTKYREEYVLSKQNDLVALGQLLQQEVIIFRCQTAVNGMEPELDQGGVPTGSYKRVELDGSDLAAYQRTLVAAQGEMRNIEKALGIDKTKREAGGTHTVESYVRSLKRAAHQRGVHITQRTLEYEKMVNELRVRLRLLYQGDKEDRAYQNVSPKSVLDWLKEECDRLTEVDKKFANEKAKLWVGKL
jgi:hypothetical protein